MKMDDRMANILAALETFDGTYRRDEVDAALALQDEITPHLIGILESVLAEPAVYAQRLSYFGHMYAIQLLGHFREPRAHDVIVDLASLPPELPYELFADTITESLASILFATCGGSIERIVELLLNREADEYCRSAASRALVYATVEGMVPRKEILTLFGSLFAGDEAASDSEFWSFVANSVCDLYPEELMPVIEKAFADGLISTGFSLVLSLLSESWHKAKSALSNGQRTISSDICPTIFTIGWRGGLVSDNSPRLRDRLLLRWKSARGPRGKRGPSLVRRERKRNADSGSIIAIIYHLGYTVGMDYRTTCAASSRAGRPLAACTSCGAGSMPLCRPTKKPGHIPFWSPTAWSAVRTSASNLLWLTTTSFPST